MESFPATRGVLTASRGSTSAGSSTLWASDRPYCSGDIPRGSSPVAGERASLTVSPPDARPIPLERAERQRGTGSSRCRPARTLPGRPAFPANRVERRGRQRHQRGPLLVEHLGHGHVRQLASPSHRSSRRRLNRSYDSARMGGTMNAPQKPDRVLHAALLVAQVRVAEPDLEPGNAPRARKHPGQRPRPSRCAGPAPVALSITIAGGTPPICSSTSIRP